MPIRKYRLCDFKFFSIAFNKWFSLSFHLMRKLLIIPFLLLFFLFIFLLSLDLWISYKTDNKIYHSIQEMPKRDIALVLGTSKYIGKTLNSYYSHRVEAAQHLFHENKVNALLLSGDNAHRSYNEPWTMKRDMLKAGVPEENIFLDYAGFRTLDSIIRAKEVFNADKFTIVTQGFHCERALFISEYHNIDAICLAVKSPTGIDNFKIRMRETLARMKAFIDIYILNQQPKFLGPKESIQLTQTNNNSIE